MQVSGELEIAPNGCIEEVVVVAGESKGFERKFEGRRSELSIALRVFRSLKSWAASVAEPAVRESLTKCP